MFCPASDTSTLKKPTLVHMQKMCQAGQPRKEVSPDWLWESMASGRQITFKKLAELAEVHCHMLHYYLKKHGVYECFCSISDEDLDILVKTFKVQKPDSGLSYMIDWLSMITWIAGSEEKSLTGIVVHRWSGSSTL